MIAIIADGLALLTIVGTCYLILALVQVLRFRPQSTGGSAFQPAVTILKPLCGLDPQLYENLRSFCIQEYPDFQIVFGVRDRDDPAIGVVQRIIAEFPQRDLTLVVDPRQRAVNLKVANLMNMLEQAKHEILLIADADMRVRSDYLRSAIAPLADVRVGAVTTLFGAEPVAGLASRLRAMQTNDHFMPSVLVTLAFAKPTFGFGATLAFTRATLQRAGGFEAIGSHLAEDTAFTKLVAHMGLDIRVPPYVVHTIVADDLPALWDHEMRWARTLRALQPAGFAGSIVTYPLPFALLFLAVAGNVPVGVALAATVFALRILVHNAARSALQLRTRPAPWLIPVRDCLSVVTWFASFFGRDVRWHDSEFRIQAGDDVTLRGR